jgi:excisionase family DNA binding protein
VQIQKNTPVMFTPVDAARILNVSRSQLYVLLKDGALRSVKIGRSRRISENQIRNFIEQVEASDFTNV